jgi:phospholipid transport system transporter-binding protein
MLIILPEQLSIRDISRTKQEWEAVLGDESAEVIVDVASVERIDTSAMQLMMAFREAVLRKNKKFEWRSPSQAFFDSAATLGFTELLGLSN